MKKYVVVFLLCALLALSCASRPSHAAQPHMQKALVALKSAKAQLEKAAHDKEGHRAKALELVNQAILEVQKGIKAGAN